MSNNGCVWHAVLEQCNLDCFVFLYNPVLYGSSFVQDSSPVAQQREARGEGWVGVFGGGGGSHFEKGDMLMALTAESSDSTLRNFT